MSEETEKKLPDIKIVSTIIDLRDEGSKLKVTFDGVDSLEECRRFLVLLKETTMIFCGQQVLEVPEQ